MRDYLQPHFQPIVAHNGKIYAFEAFMRLAGDLSGTARFVPRWERTSLIGTAEISMLELVRGMVSNPALHGRLRIHINISECSIATGYKKITEELKRTLPFTKSITVELPQTAARNTYQKLTEFVQLCNYNQISIALDGAELNMEFTDKSSIETIKPGYIKIDCKHLMEMREKGRFDDLIQAIENASSIGVNTFVKNIESEEGHKAAILVGAKLFQGRHFYHEGTTISPDSLNEPPVAKKVEDQPASTVRLTRVLAPVRN